MLYKICFPLLFLVGLYFLLKSIGRTIALYSQNQLEVDATQVSFDLALPRAGTYEIATKRSQFAGLAPTDTPFEVVLKGTNQRLPVRPLTNLMNFKRVNMAGERITAVAEFTAPGAAEVELRSPQAHRFRPQDRLIIMPSTAGQGLGLILAIVLAGLATIGGFVASLIVLTRG
ncbi:hypothetical protein [Hymenobacter chitinivorans]|uniref:Uncharacterized protein n=1 Tax=Hymenobacter chitinivorans DSM 11115 TaxID=1121954 RepID=A0A2M9BQQ2_9BACT|nr:hypothetical protein [Hymenobacter chitinivorans]PJJ60279.1 hypothetical protein CLV45_1704 [Hymenobacter chitinivorans DSM 11115]